MSGSGFKRLILGVLAVLLIAVWIRNLLLFVPATGVVEKPQGGDETSRALIAPTEQFDDTVFALDSATRDPFFLPEVPVPKQSLRATPATTPRQVESIQASLMGHIFNISQSHIITFDSLTGRTNLYRIGDSLNGFVLKSITQSEIVWKSRKGRHLVWQMDH